MHPIIKGNPYESCMLAHDIFVKNNSEHNPDFIAGTKSWLSPNIFSTEIFPPTHTTLSEGIEGIIMVEFSLHVNQLLFVRKSHYQLPVKS